jgi:hypothetical protein
MPSAPSATVWGRKGQRTVNFTHDLRCKGNAQITKSVGYGGAPPTTSNVGKGRMTAPRCREDE